MKRTIRNNIFETNSSATQALIFADDGMEPSHLPLDNDGYIITDYGKFEYGAGDFWTQEDKLCYLVTQCYYLGGWDHNLENNYHFECLEDAVCNYTGAKGIKLLHKHEPDINHQIQAEYELPLVEEWDEESVQNFIFNKYVGLRISHD